MSDISVAKSLLKADKTCVLVCGDRVHLSEKSGIAPMMELLARGEDLKGFSVADRVVGKAVAMLFELAGIKEVFAEMVSKPALQFLLDHKIKITYKTLCENIINRKGDGLCPMEQTVLDVSDSKIAYKMLQEKLKSINS